MTKWESVKAAEEARGQSPGSFHVLSVCAWQIESTHFIVLHNLIRIEK